MTAPVEDTFGEMNVPRSIARNTIVQLAGRGVTVLLSLAILMILTRHLGPEHVGEYLLVIAIVSLLDISDFGVAAIATRELASGERDANKLLANVFLLRIVLAVVSMGLVAVIAFLLDYSANVTIAILVGSVSYLFFGIGTGSLGAAFAANLRMEFQALANIVQSVTLISLVIVVISQGLGLIGLILAYDASILANSAVVILFSRRFVAPRFRLDIPLCRTLLVASFPLAVANVAWMAYNRIDLVMLSKMDVAESVGLYGLAYRFVEYSWPLCFFFALSVYPVLSRYHRTGQDDKFRSLFQKSLDVLILGGLGLTTAVFVFAKPVLSFIGSGDFLRATTSLRILSLAVVPIWLTIMTSDTLMVMGKQAALVWTNLGGLIINVGLNLVLIPRFSFDGAAAATVATESGVLLLLMIIAARHLGYFPSLAVVVKAAPVAAAAGAAGFLLEPGGIVLQAAAMVLIFGLGLILMRLVSIDELRALWRAPVEARAALSSPPAMTERQL
jgi:O-antigen/teichoic acid export membrane protein